MSKSSIKTKTVLTMTDMTESTELQAFKRPKDGCKVTVKISLCNYNENKHKIYLSDSEINTIRTVIVATFQGSGTIQVSQLPCSQSLV